MKNTRIDIFHHAASDRAVRRFIRSQSVRNGIMAAMIAVLALEVNKLRNDICEHERVIEELRRKQSDIDG